MILQHLPRDIAIVIASRDRRSLRVITGEWVLANGVISLARSWRGLGTVFSIIWPSGLCQNPSIIRYRAAGVFSGKALADCKLPLLEIPQYRRKIDFLRACQKRCVFWSLPLSSRLYKVCLRGAPGGASRRQKWFSLRRCCKINKNCENRSKNVKIEARAPRGNKNSSPKVFFLNFVGFLLIFFDFW